MSRGAWEPGKPDTMGKHGFWVRLADGDRTGRHQSWGITTENVPETDGDRIELAVGLVLDYGQTDGGHHKMWVLDQVVRVLLGDRYEQSITEWCAGEDGPGTYSWDVGIAP